MFLKRSLFPLILVIFIFSALADASSPLGGFNGARPQALGNSFAGLADDSNAFYLNPAGLADIEKLVFFSTYAQVNSNTNFSAVGAVSPTVLPDLQVGIGVRNLTLAGLQSSSETVDFTEQEIGVALAKDVGDGFALGATFRYINLGNGFAAGQAVDLGMKRVYNQWLRLGLSLQDLAGSLRYQDGTTASLPYNLIAGASFDLLGGRALIKHRQELTINLDLSKNRNDPLLYHAGLEWRPVDLIALRAGIDQSFAETQTDFSSDTVFNNLTAGLGFRYAGFVFDYAMRRNGDVSGDVVNYISVSYAFTEPPAPPTTETDVPPPPVEPPLSINEAEIAREPVARGARTVKLKRFPDIPEGHWARKEIEMLATAGLIWGYTDGNFHPNSRVSRGSLEIIISVGRHLSLVPVSDEQRDVLRGEAASRLRLRRKVDRPKQPVTRAELAMMIYQTAWAQQAIKRLPPLSE